MKALANDQRPEYRLRAWNSLARGMHSNSALYKFAIGERLVHVA
jgi:hypothetical protein